MTSGLCCSAPACRPHPASLPVRVPTVEGLPSASFSFTSRLRLAVWLRLPSSAPIGSFHPIRFCPCWAHAAAGFQPALLMDALGRKSRLKGGCRQDCLPHNLLRQRERHIRSTDWNLCSRRQSDLRGGAK